MSTILTDIRVNAERLAEAEQALQKVRQARLRLIRRALDDERRPSDIARALGVSPSRLTQLRKEAGR